MSARPDRSDPHLPPEEAARREAEVREYFEALTPKRHPKPPRSDYPDGFDPSSAAAVDGAVDDAIPELHKLRDLQTDPQELVCNRSHAVEEYVETEYYKDLNCIDKHHHTTGTGFIKVEQSNGSGFHMAQFSSTAYGLRGPCKGNPATNDWIPSADTVIPVSHKPNRSDA